MNKKKILMFVTLSTLILSLGILHIQTTSKKSFTLDKTKTAETNFSSHSFFQEELQMNTIKDGKIVGSGKARIIRRQLDPSFSRNESSKDTKFILSN